MIQKFKCLVLENCYWQRSIEQLYLLLELITSTTYLVVQGGINLELKKL